MPWKFPVCFRCGIRRFFIGHRLKRRKSVREREEKSKKIPSANVRKRHTNEMYSSTAQCVWVLWKYFCLLHVAHRWMCVRVCVCMWVKCEWVWVWIWMWFDLIWTYLCGGHSKLPIVRSVKSETCTAFILESICCGFTLFSCREVPINTEKGEKKHFGNKIMYVWMRICLSACLYTACFLTDTQTQKFMHDVNYWKFSLDFATLFIALIKNRLKEEIKC